MLYVFLINLLINFIYNLLQGLVSIIIHDLIYRVSLQFDNYNHQSNRHRIDPCPSRLTSLCLLQSSSSSRKYAISLIPINSRICFCCFSIIFKCRGSS